MKLKEADGYLYFDGDVFYRTWEYDYIKHKGETYSNRRLVEVNTTCRELLNKHKEYIKYKKYNFPIINYSVKIQELFYFSGGFASLMDITYSENDYINLIIIAHKHGLIDKRILEVLTCKYHLLEKYSIPHKDPENIKRILENMEIEILMEKYGYGNCLFYTISLETLFELPIENIPDYIVEFFKRNGISLKSKNKILQVINILNKKIKHETSKQQIFDSISI